jgi:hypothetical protein
LFDIHRFHLPTSECHGRFIATSPNFHSTPIGALLVPELHS